MQQKPYRPSDHYIGAGAPPPIPDHPYSREEIEDYFSRIGHIGYADHNRHQRMTKRVVDYIESLPAWAQILLIEERMPIYIGSRSNIRLPKPILADSYPETYRQRILSSQFKRSAGYNAEYTISHELAHAIDNAIGNHIRFPMLRGQMRLSDIFDDWTTAMTQDMAIARHNKPRTRQKEMLEFLALYKPDDRPLEAFAFVISNYLLMHFYKNNLHAINDPHVVSLEDEGAIDRELQIDFPKMWPCFREKMIPIILKYASEKYHLRRERENDALSMFANDMQSLIDKVVEIYGCAAPNDPNLAKRLVLSGFPDEQNYGDYHNLFVQITAGTGGDIRQQPSILTEKNVSKRLRLLMPSIFEETWRAPVQAISRSKADISAGTKSPKERTHNLRTLPEMRFAATYFAMNFPDIIRTEGIESFIQHYAALKSGFYKAIEAHQASR